MKEEEILKTILKKSFTKTQVQKRIRALREFIEHKVYSKKVINLSQYLEKQSIDDDDKKILKDLPDSILNTFTKENTYKIFSRIKDLLEEIEPVGVYVPYEMDGKELEKLGKWFRENVSDSVILDLHTDPTLLGGCALSQKGVFKNFSLRYYIDKHRDEIRKIIDKHVQKQLAS